MHTVFISYSTKDSRQAEAVCSVLEHNGIPCWMAPRDIAGGSNYTKEIPVAIRGCQVFVLILSPNSQNSPWVLKELDSAVNAGKTILPFMLEDFPLNDEFNFLLTGAQRYAAYQKKAEALSALVSRIQAMTGSAEAASVDIPLPTPQPSAAPEAVTAVRCPACSSASVAEQPKKIGLIAPKEKLLGLLTIPIALGVLLGSIIALAILCAVIPVLYVVSDVLIVLCCLLGPVVGFWVGLRIIRERIRRSRVRRHIHPHPFRCATCQKTFLLNEDQLTL